MKEKALSLFIIILLLAGACYAIAGIDFFVFIFRGARFIVYLVAAFFIELFEVVF